MQHPLHRSWRPFALGLGSFLLVALGLFAVGHLAHAALTIENVGGSLGLGSADLKQTIVNIIKWALGLLGLVAIIVMLYGGFLWLTSRGNEKQIDKAKRVLINGAIGLVIILVSWAIVLFIQRFITNATNSTSAAACTNIGEVQGCVTCTDTAPVGDGAGEWVANGSCVPPVETETWSAVNEVPAVAATNVSLCSQAVELFGGLRRPADNNASAGAYTVTEVAVGTAVTGTTYLGTDHTATFMHPQDFKPNTEYEVTRAGFLSSGATPLPLTLPPEWRFTTGSEGDDTPPMVNVVSPTGTIACLKPELDVVFNEPMLPLSVNVDNLTISPTPSTGAKLVSIVMNGALDGFTASFDQPLDPGVTYTVTLSAETDTAIVPSSTGGQYIAGFKDLCVKNALDGDADGTAEDTPTDDYHWTFTTANTTTVDCTPTITSIEPTAYYGNTVGNAQQALTITGENFGVTGTGVLFPGTSALATTAANAASSCFSPGYRPKQVGSVACIQPANWTPTQIITLVPAGLTPSVSASGPVTGGAVDGGVVVQKTQNSPASTAVDIQTPHIDWVSPDNGSAGTFITISGTHFGSTPGTVYFRRTDGTEVSGTVPACTGTSGWTEDAASPEKRSQIIVQVPAGFTVGDLADIQVVHATLAGATGRSNLYRFSVNDQQHPGLCAIVPQCHDTGGGTLTATGQGLGSDLGQLTSLYIPSDPTKPVTNGTLANLDSVAGTVQSTAQSIGNDTYRFQLNVGSDATNPLVYKIPCLPAPAVVQDGSCNASAGVLPSPNPVPNATDVCRNIRLSARFNQSMAVADLTNLTNVTARRCDNQASFSCASPQELSLTSAAVQSYATANDTVSYLPAANLDAGYWYELTLRGSTIHSATGVAVGADYTWHFRVSASATNCVADAVTVMPPNAGPLYTNQQQGFDALPVKTSCAILTSAPAFSWSTSDAGLAPVTAPATITTVVNPNDHLQTIVPPGVTNGTATLTATAGSASGTARLSVQRNYCDTDADCTGRRNDGNTYFCSGSACNVATHECRPWIRELQSGSQVGATVSGPAGNLISVRGCFFGTTKGTGNVAFTNGTTYNGIDICPASWTNDEIRIQAMPDTNPPATTGSAWAVSVLTSSGLQSTNSGTYTIAAQCDTNLSGVTDTPSGGVPILCNITPPAGREGSVITYNGSRYPSATSQAFFTQANDPLVQLPLAGSSTTVPSATTLVSHVPATTGIPASATTAQTTVGVQTSAGYCIATPVDFSVSCAQNSECSTGCCQLNICRTTGACTNNFIAGFTYPTGSCRNTEFSIRFDPSKTIVPSSVNTTTIQLLRGATSVSTSVQLVGQVATIRPVSPLADGTYTIVVQGGPSGIQATDGTFLPPAGFVTPPYTVDASFRICTIARVSINSAATDTPLSSDLFTCSGDSCSGDVSQPTPPNAAGNQHAYVVRAYDANGDGPLALASAAWTQADTGTTFGASNTFTPATTGGPCPTNETSVGYCATGQNVPSGSEQLSVAVVGTGTSGTGSASIPIRTFMCAKPWPAAPDPWPFLDPARTSVPLIASHDFTFAFCADDVNGATLEDPVQAPVVSGEVRKEYFMFVNDASGTRTGDTIGVRILGETANPWGVYTHDYSPTRWYERTFGKAPSGTTFEVDGYPALREGRTVYVTADYILPDGRSYPAVYVFSHTDNARSETVNIFEQLIKNIHFNEGQTPTVKANLRNDLKQIQAMFEVVYGIAAYYRANGKNPTLDTGTYIKNLTMTAWPSWQQEFGRVLGVSLPKDPQGLWDPAATPRLLPALCTAAAGFNQTTCWDETDKVMQFPSDATSPPESSGIAYAANADGSATVYGTGSSRVGSHTTTYHNIISPATDICPGASTCQGFTISIGSIDFGHIDSARQKPPDDATDPTVTIDAPAAGAITGAVTFVTTAVDNTGGSGVNTVTFAIGGATGTVVAPGTDGKYRWTWNSRSVLNNPYTLTVTVADRAGNTASATRAYTVANPPGDSVAPVLTATAPPDQDGTTAGTQWDGSSVTLTASATENHPAPVNNTGVAKIEFYLGSSKLAQDPDPTCQTGCPNSFAASVTVPAATIAGFPNGPTTYTVVAYDGYGNTSVRTFPVTVAKLTGETPVVPPTIAITLPSGTVSGANTDVVASATDASGIDRVEFSVDADLVPRAVDFNEPYSFSWLLDGYADGSSHTVHAVAYDRFGNQATASQTVTYVLVPGPDTQRPGISDVRVTLDTGVVVPLEGAELKNTVTLHATFTDNRAMQKAELRIDGVKIPLVGSAYVCATAQLCTLTYPWNTLPEVVGPHTVTITAYDTSLFATSVSRTVNVSNQVIMAITAPRTGAVVRDVQTLSHCDNDATKVCTANTDCTTSGTCSNNTARTCTTNTDCSPGTCSNNPTRSCTTDSGCGTCSNDPARSCTTNANCGFGNTCVASGTCVGVNTGTCVGTAHTCVPDPGYIPVTVSVSRTCRTDQVLATVDFFVDGTALGSVSNCSGTCTYNWQSKATVANGSHVLTAIGRDSTGCQGGGRSTIVVDNAVNDVVAPTVDALTFNGTPWSGGAAVYVTRPGLISVQAHDPAGGIGLASVTITVEDSGGTQLAQHICNTAPQSPCDLAWNPADGANYRVIARAQDGAGNAATDLVQVVNVDTVPPQLTWVSPAAGTSATLPATITVQARVVDPLVNGYASGVQGLAYTDSTMGYPPIVSLTETPAGSGIYPAQWGNAGTVDVIAMSSDAAGNFATSSPPVSLTINAADTTPPLVYIADPALDNLYFSNVFTIIAAAMDSGAGMRDVEFFRDGVSMAPASSLRPYSVAWDTRIGTTNGQTYSITARACDRATPANCATSVPRLMRVWNEAGVTTCGTNLCSGATPICCSGACQSTACSGGGGGS